MNMRASFFPLTRSLTKTSRADGDEEREGIKDITGLDKREGGDGDPMSTSSTLRPSAVGSLCLERSTLSSGGAVSGTNCFLDRLYCTVPLELI